MSVRSHSSSLATSNTPIVVCVSTTVAPCPGQCFKVCSVFSVHFEAIPTAKAAVLKSGEKTLEYINELGLLVTSPMSQRFQLIPDSIKTSSLLIQELHCSSSLRFTISL